MFLLRLLIIVGVLATFAFIASQILVPLLTGTILFPMFRRKRVALMSELAEINAQLDDQELESALAAKKALLAKKQAESNVTQ